MSATDSPRVALARLARHVALADEGVESLDPGPTGLRATRDGTEMLGGVVSVASAGGGVALDLHVVALPEDLPALGERVRGAVRAAAREAGLDDRLGAVSVHVEDLVVA